MQAPTRPVARLAADMHERHLDWDRAIPTVRESGTDYLVPLSGEGDPVWENEWQRAVLARRLSWKANGWEMYAVTLKASDLHIERVLDEHLVTIRADLDDAVAQCNAVPRA
jgi:hypothetical protein